MQINSPSPPSSMHPSRETRRRAQPGSRTFFEKSPEGDVARTVYLKIFLGGTLAMIVMIFTILPIYWGALWKVPAHNLTGWVVDFDGGLVGQSVSRALGSNEGGGKITWIVVPASNFPGGPQELSDAVLNEDIWTAISIHAGSSDRLAAALTTPDPSYDGTQAITGYAVEARNENAYRSFVRPSIQGCLAVITVTLAQQVARSVANSTALPSVMVISPQTIVLPVSYTLNNLIPFDQPVASASTFVGMLYQLIMGFFIVMITHGAREASGYERTLSIKNLIILRFCSSFFAYFMISLCYSLLNLAFQLDVSRKFGQAGFLIFWMVNYVGMLAVALALESVITLLTPRGVPFFMLTWIISNLSVSIFPIDVLPHIFRYGYAAPFFNLSHALRTIVFGTRNRMGKSVGILLAWVLISCITLPYIQWLVRRNSTAQDAKSLSLDSERQDTTEQEVFDTGKTEMDLAVISKQQEGEGSN